MDFLDVGFIFYFGQREKGLQAIRHEGLLPIAALMIQHMGQPRL